MASAAPTLPSRDALAEETGSFDCINPEWQSLCVDDEP